MTGIVNVKKMAFQGDICIRRINNVPSDLFGRTGQDARIVTHSETGHHHVLDGEARLFDKVERDPMICYLQVTGEYADIVHMRPTDTHATVRLGKGCWEVLRQEEYTPAGWRRVED